MPRLVSRRAFKRLAARCLPEAAKARLRGRFYGYHPARVALPVEYSHDERGRVLVLDNHIRVPFHPDEREALEQQLAGASLDETAGIVSLAKNARVMFDVGAATALYSRIFCASGPDHRAVAFDASPSQIALSAAGIAYAGFQPRIQMRACA